MKDRIIDQNTKVKLSSNFYASELADEAILLERSKGIYYGLNHTGLYIFSCLKKALTITEIINLLTDEYDDIDTQDIQSVIQNFIQNMLEAKLVELVDE